MPTFADIRGWLPKGDRLDQRAWENRHRALTLLVAMHAVGYLVWSITEGFTFAHLAAEFLPVATPAVLATQRLLSRRVRELCVALGLLNASAVLVHLMDGAVEAHFHFFIVVSLLALYEQWVPYLAAFGYVLVHHVVGQSLLGGDPTINHAAAQAHPLRWAGIHAAFIAAQGVMALLAWKLNEDSRAEAAAAEARFRWQAQHDALTGLPNRLLVVERLQSMLPGAGTAVLAIGIDDLKLINDSLGHPAGDALLRAAAARLSSALEPGDLLARPGGDEYLLVLADVPTEAAGLTRAAAILETLRAPWQIGGGQHYVSASGGLRVLLPSDTHAEQVLGDADAALYRAKQLGKGACAVFDDSMRADAKRRLELDGSLRLAASEGQLRLVYQPQISLSGGGVVGVEALVRWEHPHLGMVSPADFIPLAERNGTIIEIGEWVLEEAVRQAARWDVPGLKVSVNVSPRQLVADGFVDRVGEVLGEHGVSPSQLCLEVTETAVLGEPVQTRAALDRLAAMGVGLAIDDFGVGFASLAHLRQLLPVNTLKIDKSFVDGVLEDPEDGAIVAGVIRLAHSLGLNVVAEGIEQGEQADLLQSWDCEVGQGYHFARPLDPDAVGELLGLEPSGRPVLA